MDRYDVVVIGSGNAGQAAADGARRAGRRVALVDRRELGGTCALRGCVPKKVLVAAAEAMDTIRRAHMHHIGVGPAHLDWAALIGRELALISGTSAALAASLRSRGIDVYAGTARFVSPDALDVDGVQLAADHFVVAAGSRPRTLQMPGAEILLTSEDFLARRELPRSAVFVGAGVIAMEFAHVLVRAGTKVTLVGDRVLAGFDPDVVARLVAYTRGLGVTIQDGVRVTGVARKDGGVEATYQGAAGEGTVGAEVVFHAAGRVPDTDDLDLGAAGVERDNKGPRLDLWLRSTSNPRLEFAGDAVPQSPQLSPVASYEGMVAARNLDGPVAPPNYDPIPRVVFSVPQLATVGLDPRRATEAGIAFDVIDNDMRSWRSARTYAEEEAFSRVLLEQGTGRVLGASILGHCAPELIHPFAFAIRHGWNGRDLGEMIYAYPTFHADIKYMVGE